MTITRIQYKRGTSNQSTTINVTLNNTPTVGNTLIAAIANGSDGGDCHVSSISQSGVSWSKIRSSVSANNVAESEIWLGNVLSSASKNITVNLTQSLYYHICNVCEYSGLMSSPLDKRASNSGYGNTVDSGTTATTTQANEVWVGSLCGTSGSAGLSNPTNNFTMLDGALTWSIEAAYCEKIVSTTGTANVSATTSGTPAWAGCIATFKEETVEYEDLEVGNLTVHEDATVAETLTVNGDTTCNGHLQLPASGSSITFASSTGGITGTNTGAIEFKDAYNNKKMRILGNYDTDSKYKIKNDYFNGSNWNLLSALTQDGQLKLPVQSTAAGLVTASGASIETNAPQIMLTGNNALQLPTQCLLPFPHAYSTLGNGNIFFKDTTQPDGQHRFLDGQCSSFFLVMVQDPADPLGTNYCPIIATDHGLWAEKDIQTYGALFCTSDPWKSYGGGAIMLGHGFQGSTDPPTDYLS
ncbi:MAG: hypothetical protein NWE95_08685 [Candidatus Bathyarchaeota archaeon]|nr:hypothetical protein [Candidatus Bathyarchaeota archaeon]